MKRSYALALSLMLALSPALALAQSSQSVAQLTATLATLEAQENALSSSNTPPFACAAVFSAPSVKLGESVALGWGSTGALDPLTSSSSVPMWSQNGVSTLTFTTAGTWTYSFTFYNSAGDNKTCFASVRVTK